MESLTLIRAINDDLSLALPEKISQDDLHQQLSLYINELINSNFQHLVFLLYRIDVNETKLKEMLKKDGGADAAGLIAEMIILRQKQKIESRKSFPPRQNDPSEETW